MNKEEILVRGRVDYKDNDPIEAKISEKAIFIASAAGIIVCVVLFLLKLFISKQVDLGLWTIVFAYSGAEAIYRGRKMKRTKTFISGIICSVLAFLSCFGYVCLLFSGDV